MKEVAWSAPTGSGRASARPYFYRFLIRAGPRRRSRVRTCQFIFFALAHTETIQVTLQGLGLLRTQLRDELGGGDRSGEEK